MNIQDIEWTNKTILRNLFQEYYTTKFSADLQKWFVIQLVQSSGKSFNFIPHAGGTFVPHRPAKSSDTPFHELCFSAACFFTFLIPQLVAKDLDGEQILYEFSRASGWPILSCGLGGIMHPAHILQEADLVPKKEVVNEYMLLMDVVLAYFKQDVLEFLKGGQPSLNPAAYKQICEYAHSHGIDVELPFDMRLRTCEYLDFLNQDVYVPNSVMVWNGGRHYHLNPFMDSRDGQSYHIEKLGDREWFVENYRCELNSSCVYNGDSAFVQKYGRLYTKEAAKLCVPEGWRLPTCEDVEILKDFAQKYRKTMDFAFGAVCSGGKISGEYRGLGRFMAMWIENHGVLEPYCCELSGNSFAPMKDGVDCEKDSFAIRFVRNVN